MLSNPLQIVTELHVAANAGCKIRPVLVAKALDKCVAALLMNLAVDIAVPLVQARLLGLPVGHYSLLIWELPPAVTGLW